MPGEFISFNNPGFPGFGFPPQGPPQNIIQFDRPLFEHHHHHRSHHNRRAHSNFSDDESIHLVPVRPPRKHKHSHGHGKDSGQSKEASKQNGDASATAANGAGVAASSTAGGSVANGTVSDKNKRSSSVRKEEKIETISSNKTEEKKEQSKSSSKKEKESSKDAKPKRSTSETSQKAKSKERKHKHKKQPVLVEEFFIPGSIPVPGHLQGSFGSAGFQRSVDPGFAPPPSGQRFQQYAVQEQFVPQFQQFQQFPQEQIIPGSPVFTGPQYAPIGEPIPLGSIPIGPDAIVEPIVTIGPRTDIGAFDYAAAQPIQTGFVQQQVPQQPVFTGPQLQPIPQQPLFSGPPLIEQQFLGGLPLCPPGLFGAFGQQTFLQPPPPQPVQVQVQQVPQPIPVGPVGPAYTGVYEESLVLPYPQYGPVEQVVQQNVVVDSGYGQGLPPGSKIVAEYVLGFLDDYERPAGQDTIVEIWEQKDKKEKEKDKKKKKDKEIVVGPTPDTPIDPGKLSGREPIPEPNPNPIIPSPIPPVRPDFGDHGKGTNKADFDAFKKEITDLLKGLKLGDGGAKGGDNVVQPIFLMPKQAEQAPQKPVYIPRNIYVPVIRPVFVPRERIIVRPQIIHVARPVLVDRPVPVQQRPIVIERDRPIPIRVETVEKIENIETTHSQVSPKKEVVTYETYYDDYEKRLQKADAEDHKYDAYYNQQAQGATNQTSTYQYTTTTSDYNKYQDQQASSTYQYTTNTVDDYEKILREADRKDARSGTNLVGSTQYETKLYNSSRQDLVGGGAGAYGGSTTGTTYVYEDVYTDELRKKQDIQQLINEVEKRKYDIQQKPTTSASYTLEVLDPTVSNKFERVDQSNLKSVYGIDTYQYIPPVGTTRSTIQQQQGFVSQAYPGDYISTFQPSDGSFRKSEFRTASNQEFRQTGSYSNLGTAVANSTGGYAGAGSFHEGTPAGTITNVAQIPGQGLTNLGQAPVVIQNVQKMIQNFGTSFTPESVQPSNPLLN